MQQKLLFLILFFVNTTFLFAQKGTVSGILNSETDNLPLPGVNVVVKGTTNGTQTDFDGYYNIKCEVGDVLEFSFVGMQTREVTVTKSMFGVISNNFSVKEIPVEIIQSEAYSNAVKEINNDLNFIPSIVGSEHTYNKNNYFEYNRIKSVKVNPNRVDITYFSPDIHFEVGYNSSFSLQFIKKNNLPSLQSTYGQGAIENGEVSYLGPETGNYFSYGPKMSTLEFDGANYAYDSNGKLTNAGNGNGYAAIIYDNSILKSSVKTLNSLFFNVTTEKELFDLDLSHKTSQDFFGRETSKSDNLFLQYRSKNYSSNLVEWDAFVRYTQHQDDQPNINGFQNNLLLNTWITPVSFENQQGAVLDDNTQRSFNANNFNNPMWLLDNNDNFESNQFFVASVQNKTGFGKLSLESNLNYTYSENKQKFGLVTQTIGFENGYSSQKNILKNNVNGIFKLNYKSHATRHSIDINSVINNTYEKLQYELNEASGFEMFSFLDPESNYNSNHALDRYTLRVFNQFSFNWDDIDSEIVFGNNSHISSIQKNKWFLPSFTLRLNLEDILDLYGLQQFILTSATSFDINDMPLFFDNQSHNSLMLAPSESLSYTANNDLFLNSSLNLEEKRNYSIGTSIGFHAFDTNFDFDAIYYYSETKGSVFPIYDDNAFTVKNSANISSQGFEMSLNTNHYSSDNFQFSSKISFSTNRTKVLKLLIPDDKLAIAGFTTVSQNLIVGQPAGVITGSSYARDEQSNIIIDDEGFPLVTSQPQIIGDPTPAFTIGFSNEIKWKRFTLNFVIDSQNGGDVWNGTQNVLNFFGTSQQSERERSIANYVFQGVNQDGVNNTTPVDFYNPANGMNSNLFVRYGFDGVAEDAIEDGSYLNLKRVTISYAFLNRNTPTFIRQFDISLFANNLFTTTKFQNASPFSSLFDNGSGTSLNFFNSPLSSEIGLTINIKI